MAPLTAAEALAELLARLGAAPGRRLTFSADELHRWPADAVAALKAHGVLRPGKPGDTVVCPGCERACVMAVQQRQRAGVGAVAFVVCDRRDDIGRVALPPALLERWRVDAQTLGDALAGLLGAEACHPVPGAAFAFRVGAVAGAADKADVQLRIDDGHARLEVAGHALELASALAIRAGRLKLDTRHLGRCAGAPAAGAALAAETSAKRTARLQARKVVLQQRGVKAFLPVLAEEEGVSVSMIKRILARRPEPATPTVPAWAASVTPPRGVSKGRKHQP